MKNAAYLALGIVLGAVLVGPGLAQQSQKHGLNHIGIRVKDYARAMAFYTGALGLREAYTVRKPDGSPLLTYLQLNRDTFIELIPARPNEAPGITHFGVEVGDIQAAVARLRANGVEAADPALTPAKALYTRIKDSDGAEIEVMEFGPEALQRKAMDAWKER